MSVIQGGISHDTCLARTECNKTEPYKVKGFGEKLVCLVSTFFIFMFVDQLLLVDVFSQLYYSQNSLIRTPKGQSEVSVLERSPCLRHF